MIATAAGRALYRRRRRKLFLFFTRDEHRRKNKKTKIALFGCGGDFAAMAPATSANERLLCNIIKQYFYTTRARRMACVMTAARTRAREEILLKIKKKNRTETTMEMCDDARSGPAGPRVT